MVKKRHLALAALIAGLLFGSFAHADTSTESASVPSATAFFPPGDYELEMRVTYDHSGRRSATWKKMLAAYRLTIDPLEERRNLRLAAEQTQAAFRAAVEALPNLRAFEQSHLLVLRSPNHWRLLVGDHDAYFDGSRIILAGERGEDRYRVLTFEIPDGYFRFGPIAVLTTFRNVLKLLQDHRPSSVEQDGSRTWRLALRELTESEYFALRIHPLYLGVSNGELRLTKEKSRLVEDWRDATGANILRRIYAFKGGTFSGWSEEKWLPGIKTPFEITTVAILGRKEKTASDPMFPEGFFARLKIIDRSEGGQNRVIFHEEGGIPSDAEFDRIYEESNRVRTESGGGAWRIVLLGAALLLIGLGVLRWRAARAT